MYLSSGRGLALLSRGGLGCATIVALSVWNPVIAQQLADSSVEIGKVATSEPAAVNLPQQNASTQDKHIMGVVPNYRTVDGTLPFQTVSAKYKLSIASKDTFDGPNYMIGGIFAGLYQAENAHPNLGQGVAGYTRYYGTSVGDQMIGNIMTEGFMPVLFHEDPRYFRKIHGSVFSRTVYALSRVLITRSDSGRSTFNFAEVVGDGMGGTISNLYYTGERGLGNTAVRASTLMATDAVSLLLKEFWPDIKRRMHRKQMADPLH